MSFPHFKEINPPDDIISKLETNVADVFDYLEGKQIIDGILLENVVLSAATANLVPHLLLRNPKGYIVVKKRPAPVISTSISDIGDERIWQFAAAPFGWLIEDGSAISRTTYADLFKLIGTTFGVGDGSTTFNLPDNRGKSPVGKTASGTGSTLNGTFGALDFTVSLPAHYHAKGTGADINITSSGSHTTALDHDHAAFTSGAGSPHSHSIRRDGNSAANTGGGAEWGLASPGVAAYSTTETESAHTHSIDVPAFVGNSSSTGVHVHATADFAGRIGLVTGGVDGNAAMTSGTANAPSFVRNWIMKVSSAAAFGGIDVWDADPNPSVLSQRFLQLYSTIDSVVSLWVF